jgi:hypothetical protein
MTTPIKFAAPAVSPEAEDSRSLRRGGRAKRPAACLKRRSPRTTSASGAR